MAIQLINSSDKVAVFRTKHNSSVNEIWVSAIDNGDGTVTFTKFDGTTYNLDLRESFNTKEEIQDFLTQLTEATYETSGSVEIATTEEVSAGDSETLVITPFTASNSTLFPLKGAWDSDQAANEFYLEHFIVHHNGLFYVSLFGDATLANLVEPGTDITKWLPIGGTASKTATGFTEANLVEDENGIYYLPIATSLAVLEIKYNVTSQTKSYRLSVENALEEDTAWTTNRIYNFPTDDDGVPLPQTITITTI